MVLIEHVSDPKSALWLDGYIPSLRALSEKCAALSRPELEGGREKLSRHSADSLFLQLLESWAYQMQDKEKQYGRLFWEDIYYLRPPARAGELQSYSWIRRELDRVKDNRYRLMVCVYDTDPYAMQTEYAENLIANCSFGLKSEADYLDAERFKKDVHRLLEAVLEPFELPCRVSERLLRSAGFPVNHFTV